MKIYTGYSGFFYLKLIFDGYLSLWNSENLIIYYQNIKKNI